MNRLQMFALVSSLAAACAPKADLQGVTVEATPAGGKTAPTLVGPGPAPGQSSTPATPSPAVDPTKTLSTSTVPGLNGKLAPPTASECASSTNSPLVTEDDAKMAGGVGLTGRAQSPGERKGGLDRAFLQKPQDLLSRGLKLQPIRSFPRSGGIHVAGLDVDSDGDCLSDDAEALRGTDPKNPDSDGDGWFDGACNERRKLILESVFVHESQDLSLFGGDDFYIIADDARFPQDGLDDYWQGWKSDTSHTLNQTIASRTRGVAATSLQQVTLEGYEDDWEIFNTWTVDDLLFKTTVDLGAYTSGETFTKRYSNDGYDYEATYRVDIERFADPDPLKDGDSDNDGIKESAEARIAIDFGGIVDPMRPDVLVEVDWMAGHRLRTEAKRQVVTRMATRGISLFVLRDEELPLDDCLSVKEAQAYYNAHFSNLSYNGFRYALIGEQIWNDASGVAWGDMFLVDDSTWWINDMVLPQAGTFIHELGHTLGLTKQDTFPLIDSVSWLSYDSAMNYTYQALLVDYDTNGEPGDSWRHNDWADVKPGYALKWSFSLVTSDDKGICK